VGLRNQNRNYCLIVAVFLLQNIFLLTFAFSNQFLVLLGLHFKSILL